MGEGDAGIDGAAARRRPVRHIADVWTTSAARDPNAVAIVAPGRPALTFGDLARQAEETRRALRRLGIGRGDRVALALPDGPELAVAILTTAAAATAAPLNPDATEPEFERALRALDADAVIVPRDADSPARAAAQRQGRRVIALAPEPEAGAGRFTLSGAPALAPPEGPDAPRPSDIALLLQTSGTTGEPKIVPLTHANLCAAASANGSALRLAASDRCVSMIPMHHIFQIGNMLAALIAGGSAVCLPGFDVDRFFDALAAFRPTWITGAPAMHRAILDRAAAYAEVVAQTPIRFIRSGGASLSPALLDRLERTFGAPVLEGYGLTETSPTMTSNPLPPRVRKPGSVGVAVGCEVAVIDAAGERLPAGLVGEVVVRGPNVMRGYLGEPEMSEDAFTPDGWFRTGDLGSFDADGYLFLTGRLKEIINRGGQKIAPGEVEAALAAHPAVAAVAVFAVPDERLGEEVAAAVVTRDGATIEPADLRAFVAPRLAWHKAPRRIVIVDRLPTTRSGKPIRVGLARALGLAGDADERARSRRHVAPVTPVERFVAEIWAETLGRPTIGLADTVLDLGGDSLAAARIVTRLDAALGMAAPLADLLDHLTVGDLAALVERHIEREADA